MITEQGYLRNINHNNLNYSSIRLADESFISGAKDSLRLKHKNYAILKPVSIKIDFHSQKGIDGFKQITEIEPETAPNDYDLFQIWKHEYIEKGLREY